MSYLVSSRTHVAQGGRETCVELARRWGVPVVLRVVPKDKNVYVGWSHPCDRRWIIHTQEFSAQIGEYHHVLTCYDVRLKPLAPDFFVYGGNAYYITGALAQQRGWRVEEVPRR